MVMSEILDVVNDNDEVIGQAERDRVHREGLVCRLVYVCFYTTNREIILQKRSDTKKNDPGKLTTTVSGHVASGQSYAEAATRETVEESGIEVSAEDLKDLGIRAEREAPLEVFLRRRDEALRKATRRSSLQT